MQFTFTEEQLELRKSARRFLDTASSPERVRAAMATDRGYDPAVWSRISDELGWPALTIPEADGGIGLGPVELTALFEETGRALLCAPLMSTVALGANALIVAGTEAQRGAHLPAIAEGRTTVALAHIGASGRWDAAGIDVVARTRGSGFTLSGAARHVIDGHTAELLVVAARAPGSAGREGVGLFLVPASTPGVVRAHLPTMDQTRRLAEVTFTDVAVPAEAVMIEPVDGWPALQRILDLAIIALAAEQVGGAEACLDMAVDYAKTRVQFGRPIGSFQAIKHKCADMLTLVESARSAAYGAACAAAVGDAELHLMAATAKAYCSEAYMACAAENIQVHGGIGFTWEHDAHLHFKRARASETLFGAPSFHRDTVAREIGLI